MTIETSEDYKYKSLKLKMNTRNNTIPSGGLTQKDVNGKLNGQAVKPPKQKAF